MSKRYSIEGLTAPQLRAINVALADHQENSISGDYCPTPLPVVNNAREKVFDAMRRQGVEP